MCAFFIPWKRNNETAENVVDIHNLFSKMKYFHCKRTHSNKLRWSASDYVQEITFNLDGTQLLIG